MKGKCWTFGDHVDTDQIIPARYLNTTDPAELAAHCMEDADADFPDKVGAGDIIVAGENFGCGSSREHAPLCLKHAGVGCVIAKSFARIFFRNAINIGLPILECPEAVEAISEGDIVEVDLAAGKITLADSGQPFATAPFPRELQDIIAAGGLMNYVKTQVDAAK
jgi:3-isopropylmalate/(R)-2-methylmalate dehydratase small subunit